MADKKIIELTALVTQATTDLYETSANGAGSFKETRAQQLTYTKANIAGAPYAIGDLIYASSSSALGKIPDIATNNVLLSGGVGVAPTYGKVTYAHLQTEGASTLLGNPAGAPGAVSEITLGAGLGFSGTTLVNTLPGGGSSAIVLYVSSDGDDTTGNGTVEKPFATYSKAQSVAVLSASIVTRYTVLIQGIINEPGNITISPFVNITGNGVESSQLIVAGDILGDPLWDSTIQPSFEMSSITLDGGTFELIFGTGQYVVFNIKNVTLLGSLPNITFIGSGSFTESIFIDGLHINGNCAIQLFDLPGEISNSRVNNFELGSDSNSNSASVLLSGTIFDGVITVTSTGSASTAASIFGCQTYPGIKLDGTSTGVSIDASSYQNNFTFASGATINQVNIISRAEGSFANSNFTPVNYTPVANADYPAGSVVGNLAGIDAALVPNVNGATIVSSINTSAISVANSQSIKIGNVGTLTGRINFTATASAITINIAPPFGTAFTAINQAGGLANVIKTSGGSIGDGTMLNVNSISGIGLQVNLSLASGTGDYSMYFSFQYTISN